MYTQYVIRLYLLVFWMAARMDDAIHIKVQVVKLIVVRVW